MLRNPKKLIYLETLIFNSWNLQPSILSSPHTGLQNLTCVHKRGCFWKTENRDTDKTPVFAWFQKNEKQLSMGSAPAPMTAQHKHEQHNLQQHYFENFFPIKLFSSLFEKNQNEQEQLTQIKTK